MIQTLTKEMLHEIVERAIYDLLKEEQGISNFVTDKTIEIVKQIKSLIKTIQPTKNLSYVYRQGQFDIELFDNYNVTINFQFYNFKSYDAYEEFIAYNSNGFIADSSFDKHIINLSFFAILGEIDERTLSDQCQHEISHLYMAYRKNSILFSIDILPQLKQWEYVNHDDEKYVTYSNAPSIRLSEQKTVKTRDGNIWTYADDIIITHKNAF